MRCCFNNPNRPGVACPDEALPNEILCGHHSLVFTYVSELVGVQFTQENNPAVLTELFASHPLIQ